MPIFVVSVASAAAVVMVSSRAAREVRDRISGANGHGPKRSPRKIVSNFARSAASATRL